MMGIALILGAGASRGVSYAREREVPSPLDRDFFDLLQRFDPDEKDEEAVAKTLGWVRTLSHEYWRSMERAFYTLHLKAHLLRKLHQTPHDEFAATDDAEVVGTFATAFGALLRAAHGTETCSHHRSIFSKLLPSDGILSFNYDLVAERAMKAIPRFNSVPFGDWLYGFSKRPKKWTGPTLLKLHGSFNWRIPDEDGQGFTVRTNGWPDLERAPGITRFTRSGTSYPIFLPFWDKQIESSPWRGIWLDGLKTLSSAESVIVWGYSLPQTDLKARVVLEHALANKRFNLCVIDPSLQVRDRWRAMFPDARFWEFDSIESFLDMSPAWWRDHPDY